MRFLGIFVLAFFPVIFGMISLIIVHIMEKKQVTMRRFDLGISICTYIFALVISGIYKMVFGEQTSWIGYASIVVFFTVIFVMCYISTHDDNEEENCEEKSSDLLDLQTIEKRNITPEEAFDTLDKAGIELNFAQNNE